MATVRSLAAAVLPATIKRWREVQPDVSIRLLEFASRSLVTEAVEDGRADLGIGPLPAEWGGARIELGWEQLILVMPLGDPLAQSGQDLSLESLSGRQWVLYEEGHGLGEQALLACRAAGFEPEWAVRTAQVEVAARLAAAGIGPALVPIKNVPPELHQHVRGVDPPVSWRVWAYVTGPEFPATAGAFVDVLVEGPWQTPRFRQAIGAVYTGIRSRSFRGRPWAGSQAVMPVSGWQQGKVRVVVIDRPDRANSIDLETAEALAATFDELERDDDTWAVVLTGAGERVFSAGMDLKAVHEGQADKINGVPGGFAGLVRRDFPKPIVAAVNGAAMGGGFEIVLACDLVVAAEHARFGLPEVTVGLMAASGGAVRLPQRLPWPVAMELLLLGEPVDAQRALELQLVNSVVPGDDVVDAAVELAERLAANGPLAVQASKRVARTTLADGEAAGWELNAELAAAVTGSEDAAEAAEAASEKREPAWSGR